MKIKLNQITLISFIILSLLFGQVRLISAYQYVADTKTIVLHFDSIEHMSQCPIGDPVIGYYEDIRSVNIQVDTSKTIESLKSQYSSCSYITDIYQAQAVYPTFIPNDTYYSSRQWNLKQMNMEAVWEYTKGSADVVVAVIDTGVGPYSDITTLVNGVYINKPIYNSSNVWIRDQNFEDTYPGQYSYDGGALANSNPAIDNLCIPHGTAVASIIASQLSNSLYLAGIAPNVSIMSVKVFDDASDIHTIDNVGAYDTDIALGIHWAVDHGADIINMSLGQTGSTPALLEAVQYAYSNGVVLVGASGNDGSASVVSYPAAYDEVISVGSINQSNSISSFSNRGNDLKLVAYGGSIYLPNIEEVVAGQIGFYNWNGTSFSSPTVAAIAALLLSYKSDLSNLEIAQLLYSSATDLVSGTNEGLGWDTPSGFGSVNPLKALQMVDQLSISDGNDTIVNAETLLGNDLKTSYIVPINDVDTYQLTLYEAYPVSFVGTSLGLNDVVLILYNDVGQELQRQDTPSNQLAVETLTRSLSVGTYYIQVQDYLGLSYADGYTLEASFNDVTKPSISASSNGSPVSSGANVYENLTLSIQDSSKYTAVALKNGLSYPYPSDGLFTDVGSYAITVTDAKSNASTFSFTIQDRAVYTLSYVTNNGTSLDSISVSYPYVIAEPTGLTKAGYFLDAWFTDSEFTLPFNFNTDTLSSDTTLYAHWTLNQFSVTLDANGGVFALNDLGTYQVDSVGGEIINFDSANNPTRLGYSFMGWMINDVSWNMASDIALYSNMTLTALWFDDSHSVSPSITGVNYNSISFSWSAYPLASYYEIYDQGSNLIGQTTNLAYTVSSLAFNRSFSFSVQAVCVTDGYLAKAISSNLVSAKTSLNTPILSASVYTYTSLRLSWPAVAGASSYTLYRSSSLTGTYSIVTSTSALSYINTGLSFNATYYYKIIASLMDGATKVNSSYSSVVSSKVLPSTISTFQVGSNTYTSIKMLYGAISGASGYEIYRATSLSGTYAYLTRTTYTSYINTGLSFYKIYYYKVRAYRYVGSTRIYGAFSAVGSAKANLTTPTFTLTRINDSSIKVACGSMSGATGFEVYRSTTLSGTYAWIKTLAYAYRSFTNTSLINNKVYYYRVRAYRLVGGIRYYSPYSSILSK
ncbi:MAG: S8 family serine peptidase, partial [Erysipelotrichaceae bacterium]